MNVKSIAIVKAAIARLRRAEKEFAPAVREMYLAKGFLTSQKGQRRDPYAPNYIQYTWNDYCEAIGLDRQTADYWVKKFIPRELSETGEDILLIKAPPAAKSRRKKKGVAV